MSLVPSLGELIVALGETQRLVAKTDFDTHESLAALPSIGGGLDPNLERMIDLGINVVFMPTGRDAPAMAERIESLGISVVSLPTNSVPDLFRAIDALGEFFGVPTKADSLADTLEEMIARVEERIEGFPPVPVMYVVAPSPPVTTGPGTFIDDLVRLAGGANVFADADLPWPAVGFEAIVARDPEALIWPQGEYSIQDLRTLQSTPGWRTIPAVQEGRVLFVDGDLFSRPGPGFPAAVEALARALHSSAFNAPGGGRP